MPMSYMRNIDGSSYKVPHAFQAALGNDRSLFCALQAVALIPRGLALVLATRVLPFFPLFWGLLIKPE